jgi:hypothetical protein
MRFAPPAVAGDTLYLAARNYLYAIRDDGGRGDVGPTRVVKRGRSPAALFVPTPTVVVVRMLALAGVNDRDVVYDLGSGDGRIVIAAASDFRAKGVGVEIDLDLVEQSRKRVVSAGMEKRVTIVHEDLLKIDLAPATVITLYVGAPLTRRLLPALDRLAAGVRIVSHEFELPGVKADSVQKVFSDEDGRDHALYLYTTPLKR